MKMCLRMLAILIAAGLVFQGVAWSQEAEREYDPLKRNLIFVEAESEATIPVNMFKLKFRFEVQKATFSEAEEESARMVKAVTEAINKLGLPNVEVIKGWDMLTQAKISVGTSGRKVSNRLTVKVWNFPEDKMHELIAKIVDNSLAVNKDITFDNIEVGLTEGVESEKRETLIVDALKKLKTNADKTAESQGVKVSAAKRIFVLDEGGQPAARFASYARDGYTDSDAMAKSFISVQKGFTIQSQVSDHVKMTAKVSGMYEIQ